MEKRKSVPTDVVLKATFDGMANGLTSAQVAEQLGMSPNSYSVRLSHLRKKLKPLGKDIPRFGRKVAETNVQALASQFADSLVDVAQTVTDPTVAEVLSE